MSMSDISENIASEAIAIQALDNEAQLFDAIIRLNRDRGLDSAGLDVVAFMSSICIAEVQKSDGRDTTWLSVMSSAYTRRGYDPDELSDHYPHDTGRFWRYPSRLRLQKRKPDTSPEGILKAFLAGKFQISD